MKYTSANKPINKRGFYRFLTGVLLWLMTSLPLICRSSDSDFQQKWLVSRGAFYESTLALAKARDLSQPQNDQLVFTLPLETREKISQLEQKGLLLSSRISDEFLEWVHPQLRAEYREHLLKGTQIYINGKKANDVEMQQQGGKLVRLWIDFWDQSGSQIADKLYPDTK